MIWNKWNFQVTTFAPCAPEERDSNFRHCQNLKFQLVKYLFYIRQGSSPRGTRTGGADERVGSGAGGINVQQILQNTHDS